MGFRSLLSVPKMQSGLSLFHGFPSLYRRLYKTETGMQSWLWLWGSNRRGCLWQNVPETLQYKDRGDPRRRLEGCNGTGVSCFSHLDMNFTKKEDFETKVSGLGETRWGIFRYLVGDPTKHMSYNEIEIWCCCNLSTLLFWENKSFWPRKEITCNAF